MTSLSPLLVGTGLLLGAAGAAPVISAQSIIVNPAQTTLTVKVWTDRGSGTQVPGYVPGERIRLYTSVNQDAYVYLFNVDPQGHVDLILPNRFQGGGNFLKANTTRTFPAASDPFTFNIAAPYGLNKVLALASRTPLKLDQIATFKAQQDSFATVNLQGQEKLAQALSIVVNPVPAENWISATAYYNVAQPSAAAPLQTPATAAQTATAPPPRGTPIQPVAPKASALSVTVQPATPTNTPQPLPAGREWQTTVERSGNLGEVYAEFAARVRAEGYSQVSMRQTGNHIRGEFRKGTSSATLEVKQKGKRFEVQLNRR
ncbi:DUF4384 domain-containing protein [Deinococcus hopiensis]|uniref:DUF4384 domain-containing protein n=1 Tax=Deinococcus hopiensis KR-140 TaxID=695939 RepID=A0A1W1VDK1_9DEIO|nr:DUF4384 domain-containing protein [Deinococcus hopiensis]SMB91024.1 protein of unknown function [Deinococcus hopiensis KR-140]